MLASKQLSRELATRTSITERSERQLDAVTLDEDAVDRLRAAIGRLARRLRPTLAAAGLTPSQVSLLFTVVRRGPVGLSELAVIEDMNPTMVSRIVLQLSGLGLIQRETRPEDRRAATVAATAAGRRLRERVHRERTRALSAYLAELDAKQVRLLEQALPALEHLAALIAEQRS